MDSAEDCKGEPVSSADGSAASARETARDAAASARDELKLYTLNSSSAIGYLLVKAQLWLYSFTTCPAFFPGIPCSEEYVCMYAFVM